MYFSTYMNVILCTCWITFTEKTWSTIYSHYAVYQWFTKQAIKSKHRWWAHELNGLIYWNICKWWPQSMIDSFNCSTENSVAQWLTTYRSCIIGVPWVPFREYYPKVSSPQEIVSYLYNLRKKFYELHISFTGECSHPCGIWFTYTTLHLCVSYPF